MGSTPSSATTISPAEFNQHWSAVDSLDHLTVWQNKEDPSLQLEEYHVQNYDSEKSQKFHRLRKFSPYLVGATTLSHENFTCCAGHQGERVFIQRIPLRLSNIEDIPYPDVIHLFNVCIKGFRELTKESGFFNVDEDQIGINEKGQVKVWLNPAFQSSEILGTNNVPENEMLRDIYNIIESTSDSDSYPDKIPNLLNFIGAPSKTSTFSEFEERFNNYVNKFTAGHIPTSLECVHKAGGASQISNWCRQNSSFGFGTSSLRLPEKIKQSKLFSSQLPAMPLPSSTNVIIQNAVRQEEKIIQRRLPENSQIFHTKFIPNYPQVNFQQPPHFSSIGAVSQKPVPVQYFQIVPQPQQYSSIPPRIIEKRQNIVPFEREFNKDEISSFAQPSQSRLQQQRVISQTIEVKQSFKSIREDPTYNLTQRYEDYKPIIKIQEQSENRKLIEVKSSQVAPPKEQLQSYGRAIPYSVNVNEQRNISINTDDGKSSPDFLALLNQLKNNSDKAQVYSQVADTPASVAKQESQNSRKRFQGVSLYTQAQNDSDIYTGRYNFTKYERSLDPELQADMQRYK